MQNPIISVFDPTVWTTYPTPRVASPPWALHFLLWSRYILKTPWHFGMVLPAPAPTTVGSRFESTLDWGLSWLCWIKGAMLLFPHFQTCPFQFLLLLTSLLGVFEKWLMLLTASRLAYGGSFASLLLSGYCPCFLLLLLCRSKGPRPSSKATLVPKDLCTWEQ